MCILLFNTRKQCDISLLHNISMYISVLHKTGYVHKCIHRNSNGMYSYFIMDTINKYSDNQQCITIRKGKT
jgi:hypothetical protein